MHETMIEQTAVRSRFHALALEVATRRFASLQPVQFVLNLLYLRHFLTRVRARVKDIRLYMHSPIYGFAICVTEG